MSNNLISELKILDNGLTIGVDFNCNLKYFKGDIKLAKKIIESTVEHFRNQMIDNNLAVPKSQVLIQ